VPVTLRLLRKKQQQRKLWGNYACIPFPTVIGAGNENEEYKGELQRALALCCTCRVSYFSIQ
jgi:hypothetical protein